RDVTNDQPAEPGAELGDVVLGQIAPRRPADGHRLVRAGGEQGQLALVVALVIARGAGEVEGSGGEVGPFPHVESLQGQLVDVPQGYLGDVHSRKTASGNDADCPLEIIGPVQVDPVVGLQQGGPGNREGASATIRDAVTPRAGRRNVQGAADPVGVEDVEFG